MSASSRILLGRTLPHELLVVEESQPSPTAAGNASSLPILRTASTAPSSNTPSSGSGKPLVTAITKDGATKLYTIAVKDGHPLALDLSGELVWSTCDASHSTVLPYEREPNPKGKLLLLVVISFLSVLPWHTLASGSGKPLVTAITKDGATKLYTIAVKDGHPLALDLSGELVWSTCDASHSTVLPYERECVEIILSSSLWGPHKARRRGGGGRAGSSHGWSIKFGIRRPNLFLHWLLRSSSRTDLCRHRRPTLEFIVLATAGVAEEEEETTKPAVASLRLGDV
ncbi:hypothetical protein OsJ_07354 [Oryza sativa Japonica Group]|uniref:Uncharacterized protein n=1 Tax=Oryza sativa subsp. japonica TaxID=39947 RepID=B9F0U7_ORYSJ|nr:hypothetical protein OsJ_07354 [Oryza sativa Japonica Group]